MDIEQIEVVRGPASAVWGANAFTGVVNVLTRPPAAAEGSSLMVDFTSFNRDAGSTVDDGSGVAYGATTTMSRKVSERLAYRISGGYAASDPFPRPLGTLPRVPHPLEPETLVGGGELPADDQDAPGHFRNRGTTQPHVDLRLDQETTDGRVVYSAGVAGTDGIAHTGIGPFNFERGTYLGYVPRGLHPRPVPRRRHRQPLRGEGHEPGRLRGRRRAPAAARPDPHASIWRRTTRASSAPATS